MYDLEGVLGPSVTQFVESHVRSLLTWDVLVFFHNNPETTFDAAGLADRLGRRVEEVKPEVESLCKNHVLECDGGRVHYRPAAELRGEVASFVEASQDRARRLALIALVMHSIGKNPVR